MENALPHAGEGRCSLAGDSFLSNTTARHRKPMTFILPDGSVVAPTGKAASILHSLIAASGAGLTQRDVFGVTTRLSAAIHRLRHRHCLSIVTDREPNAERTGSYGRYRLLTHVVPGTPNAVR